MTTPLERQGAWLGVLPAAYALHVADEFFVGTGLYTWIGSLVPFSAPSFLGVNVMILASIAAAAAFARRSDAWRYLALAPFTLFALHGLVVHPAWSLWAGEPSPGLMTGFVVLLPLAFVGFRDAWPALSRRERTLGVAAGLLLFASQDFWRVAFNAVFLPVPIG